MGYFQEPKSSTSLIELIVGLPSSYRAHREYKSLYKEIRSTFQTLRDCFGEDFEIEQLEDRLQTLCAEKHDANNEIKRLRDIINPSDAAAYEEERAIKEFRG